MKYTINGFSQKKLVEFNIDIDEALLLRYFIDFKDSQKMVRECIDNDMYYWVNYDAIRAELPILNISKDRVYRKFKHLSEIGILKRKTKKKGGTFSFYAVGEKYIELIDTVKITDSTVKTTEGYGKNNGGGTVKTTEGYGKNNGTKYSSIKYSSIKKDSSIKDNIYKTIIDYLNSGANTKYKSTTKKTQSLIKARMNEGFSLEDFKTVIDKKCVEWINTEYEKYLRPETIFGNKFESYLNQKPNNGPHGGEYNINVKKEGEIIAADKRNYCEGLEEQGIGI